jgi:copper chaperone CopZ
VEVIMQKVTYDVPSLYGDHHVIEVRRILLEMPGVEDVYASSSFHIVEVTYDPQKVNDLQIAVKLDEAGYLGEWSVTSEPDSAERQLEDDKGYFRHTNVYEQTRQVVSFTQTTHEIGRPLWPCPGMGILKNKGIEEN